MSSLPTAYTPLESLLLFQALRTGGNESNSFNRISDELKSIPLVRNDLSYDPDRLSPDALRQLYLDLLKEEAKRDLERQLHSTRHSSNGDVSPGSRKRKAPSPSLPTVHEAAQHSHLIPQLVTRLYARYREITVKDIRDNERKYDQLVHEVGDIKAGKCDEKLQTQQTTSNAPSPKPSGSATAQDVLAENSVSQSPTSTTLQSVLATQNTVEPALSSQAKIAAVINHAPKTDAETGGHRRSSSNTTLPPLSEMAPHSPRYGIPPRIPTAPTHGYQLSSPVSHPGPYPAHHGHPPGNAVGSPQLVSRPSSSPRPILPPPPGMAVPLPLPGSPNHHAQGNLSSPHNYPPQPRASVGHAGPHSQHGLSGSQAAGTTSARGVYTPIQPPPQPATAVYYPQPPYQDRRTSFSVPSNQSPTYLQQTPPAGGYMLPPFQVASQDPTKPQQQNTPGQGYHQQLGASNAHFPQLYRQPQQQQQHQANAPATGPRLQPQPTQRLMSEVLAALATPPRQQRQPVWKSERRPPPALTPSSPKRPDVEPMSPQLARVSPPVRTGLSARLREAGRIEPTLPQQTRSLRKMRQAREGSVASSAASRALRATRSTSVSSAIEDTPVPEDRHSMRPEVKAEPSTPGPEDDEVSAPTPTHGLLTRKRRGTLQSITQGPTSTKRRRQHSAEAAERDDADIPNPSLRSNTVIATRNFAKMSSVIMNDINSHKHGSRFAQPVRDKDAEGYSSFIKRPQDLKSIRTSITHGARAITAATASVAESPSGAAATPSSATAAKHAETTVELERTIELIPPKAIVNGAQLEKEIMRMFANAVMFNPGEDGMVADTREMFEDVEAKISEWRGAERDIAPGPAAGVVVDEEDEGRAKRRKA